MTRLGIVVRPPAEEIARRIPWVDRVHVFDKRGSRRGFGGLARMALELREESYGVAYVPHPSPRSALLAARAAIPVRVGSTFGALARMWLTEWRPAREEDTFVGARLRLMGDREAGDPSLQTLRGGLVAERPYREGTRRRIGIVLGSEWATKRWPVARAVELANALDPSRERLVLLGASAERALYDALKSVVAYPDVLEDVLGGTVGELIDRIAGCDALVAGDTGPLHVARALGVPVVALFGPTSENRHALARSDRLLQVDLTCRPCSDHGHRACPLAHHRCLDEIGGDRVLRAIRALAGPD